MSKKNEELQNPEEWDFENAEKRPGVKNLRAIVSVAFTRHDLDVVALMAERTGMKTSEFIRTAALNWVMAPQTRFDLPAESVTEAHWATAPEEESAAVSVA